MTDTTFPFDKVAAVAAEPEAEPDRRRVFLLVGGGLAAAGLAAVAVFGFGGGDDVALEQAGSVVRAPAAAVAPAAAAQAQTVPVANTEAFARNPFAPRYVAPPAVPAVPVLDTQSPALPPLPLDLGGTSGGVVSPPTEVQAPPPAAEYPVALVSISDPQPEARVVTWSVDGSDVQVIPGQRFGRYGELVVLAYSLKGAEGGKDGVVLQVGDASPVVVTVGETVSVL